MSYVPEDIEVRRNALAKHQAMQAAEAAWQEAGGNSTRLPAEAHDKIEEIWRQYYIDALELDRKRNEAIREVTAAHKSDNPLEAAYDAAVSAYNEAPGGALLENEDEAVICAKSGIPIWEDDEVVEDGETGEVFLRAALGLPPRPVEDESEDIEEAA